MGSVTSDPFAAIDSGRHPSALTGVVAPPADPDAVPGGTSAEVLSWVGEDVDRAQRALDAENERPAPRVGVVKTLTARIENQGSDHAPPTDDEAADVDDADGSTPPAE